MDNERLIGKFYMQNLLILALTSGKFLNGRSLSKKMETITITPLIRGNFCLGAKFQNVFLWV